MAKGRLITQEMSTDPALNGMSIDAHYCYMLAFTHLDRDGLIDGHPVKLWATICPLRYDLLDRMPHLINQWLQSGHVVRYDIGQGKNVLFFKTFRRYNLRMKYDNEAASTFPPPPGWQRSRAGLIPDDQEERERMAELFDERSIYRLSLLNHLTSDLSRQESRVGRDKNRDKSRDLGRDQDQYKISDHGGGGDQIIHSPTTVNGNGGVQGGDDPIINFDRATLETAAWELGSLLSFHTDWTNYRKDIASYSNTELIALLKWIKRHYDDPSLSAGAQSLVATVRANIKKKTPVYLSGKQVGELLEQIWTCIEPDTWQDNNQLIQESEV